MKKYYRTMIIGVSCLGLALNAFGDEGEVRQYSKVSSEEILYAIETILMDYCDGEAYRDRLLIAIRMDDICIN